MKNLILPLTLSALVSIPWASSAKPEEVWSFEHSRNHPPSMSVIIMEEIKDRFLEVISQDCSSPERLEVNPQWYYYYPSVWFQFNVMTQKLQLCNWSIPQRLWVSNMEMRDCWTIWAPDNYACTLSNGEWKNEMCLVVNPDWYQRVEFWDCATAFPRNN